MRGPTDRDRYAVVSPEITEDGPCHVMFYTDMTVVLDLMTRYANTEWAFSIGFSVWHRRTERSPWKLITA